MTFPVTSRRAGSDSSSKTADSDALDLLRTGVLGQIAFQGIESRLRSFDLFLKVRHEVLNVLLRLSVVVHALENIGALIFFSHFIVRINESIGVVAKLIGCLHHIRVAAGILYAIL